MITKMKPPTNGSNAPKVDRRRNARSSMGGCRAALEVGLLGRLRGANTNGNYPVVNLSEGGLLLLGARGLTKGTRLKLRVTAEAYIGTMRFKARVIWSRKVVGKSAYRIGLQFTKVDADTFARLHSMTHDLYFRSKKKSKKYQ